MKHFAIAIYPGDGIGLEVTAQAVRVLRAAAERVGVGLHLKEFEWGIRFWRKTGCVVPDDFLEALKGFDAIFLGAVGYPEVLPDHITLTPLIRLRQAFDQYACVRPATLLPGVSSPLVGKTARDIDFVVVRENSEGEYVDTGGSVRARQAEEVAIQTALHTRKGIERILRYAFDLARQRTKRLALATKSNAWRHGMVLWDRVFAELAPQYDDVSTEKFHVDAMTVHFVRTPERFDVVVGSNLFGDILSDLSGAIAGSLGLAPSANINPERTFPSLFEPVHGSAPDIAGQGIANPIAAIRSVAMMLDFLGQKQAAQYVDRAVKANLIAGAVRTPDLGGTSSTVDVGDDIVGRIKSQQSDGD